MTPAKKVRATTVFSLHMCELVRSISARSRRPFGYHLPTHSFSAVGRLIVFRRDGGANGNVTPLGPRSILGSLGVFEVFWAAWTGGSQGTLEYSKETCVLWAGARQGTPGCPRDPGMPQGPRASPGYLGIPRGTPGYLQVPEGTLGYRGVP